MLNNETLARLANLVRLRCADALASNRPLQALFEKWFETTIVRFEVVMPLVIEYAITGATPVQIDLAASVAVSAFSFHLIDDFNDAAQKDFHPLYYPLICQNIAVGLLNNASAIENKRQAVNTLITTFEALINGQIHYEQNIRKVENLTEYNEIVKNRTAIAYGMIGKLVSEASSADVNLIFEVTKFSESIGMAVQIINDLEGTFEVAAENDLVSNKINYPILILAQNSEDERLLMDYKKGTYANDIRPLLEQMYVKEIVDKTIRYARNFANVHQIFSFETKKKLDITFLVAFIDATFVPTLAKKEALLQTLPLDRINQRPASSSLEMRRHLNQIS
jgi:Polyprenyl synthetase